MRLLRLTVKDFRNLSEVEVEPSVHATIAVGQNGQGKTNLLEALYYLCTLKPLRAGRLQELVRFGAGQATVTGRFLLRGAERVISVQVQDGARSVFVDGKKAASLEEYFGGVAVVAFTPDDLHVVKGGPDGRRAFLDRAVFNRFPAYLKEGRAYARALKNRNKLLKDQAEPAYLAAYDEALAQAGARVWTRRRALMEELSGRAAAAFERIGRTADPATFRYVPHGLKLPPECPFGAADEGALSAHLLQRLGARLPRDGERGYTSVGPHADDVALELGGRSARDYASQGQQRAFVLAWKVAEIENLSAALGHLPLLLLDDVSSELDPERNAYLMAYLSHSGAQVVLTTTDGSLVRAAAGEDTAWLSVRGGAVRAEGS
ncbi:MAG: DNA replication/repair protein RecF [Deltaproteobacteria bacterium]|nr:DNA replication/repair protein RecF [Deltaproteobacteria bacterium]